MKKLIMLMLMIGSLGIAQITFAQSTQSTIYQTVTVGNTGNLSSVGITNIGQTSHQLQVHVNSNVSGCSGNIFLEGSSNATNYVALFGSSTVTNMLTGAGQTADFNLIANGLYPYVRVRVTAGPTCTYSIWYTGTKITIAPAFSPYTEPTTFNVGAHKIQQFITDNVNFALHPIGTPTGFIHNLIVGVAGSGTGCVAKLAQNAGAAILLTVNATQIGVYPLDFVFQSGVDYDIIVTGCTTSAPLVTVTGIW